MTDMIERVAEAIFDVTPFRENCGPFSEQSDLYQRLTRVYARAAIEAMLEPTNDMHKAMCECYNSPVCIWMTGIKRALVSNGDRNG